MAPRLARNLDLIAGGALALIAVALSSMTEPALAIVLLASGLAVLVIWLGDEGLEVLWLAYSRTPACPPEPRRRRARSPPRGPVQPSPADAWARARIPVARVVRR